MKKLFLIMTVMGIIASPALANHSEDHAAVKQIMIKVNGLVCDFCARALEKVFYKQDGVEGVVVNLDTHLVTLNVTEDKVLSDDLIAKLVNDSGYSLVEIKRE